MEKTVEIGSVTWCCDTMLETFTSHFGSPLPIYVWIYPYKGIQIFTMVYLWALIDQS